MTYFSVLERFYLFMHFVILCIYIFTEEHKLYCNYTDAFKLYSQGSFWTRSFGSFMTIVYQLSDFVIKSKQYPDARLRLPNVYMKSISVLLHYFPLSAFYATYLLHILPSGFARKLGIFQLIIRKNARLCLSWATYFTYDQSFKILMWIMELCKFTKPLQMDTENMRYMQLTNWTKIHEAKPDHLFLTV
jgi:hypothetical protein